MSEKKFNYGGFDTDTGLTDVLHNVYSDSASEFTPIRPLVKWQIEFDKISKHFHQLPFIINTWQSNVGSHGSTVYMAINENSSDTVRRRKAAIQKKIKEIIYTKHDWNNIELQIIRKIAIEGNAVLLFNKDGKLIVESINRFNVYEDKINKINRYAYIVDGAEKKGMTNLRHGVDLWHIKDPAGIDLAVSPSRLLAAMQMILLDNKATRMNIHMFANGFMSNIFLKFYNQASEAVNRLLSDEKKDSQGKTWVQRIVESVRNRFTGVENAGKIGIIPYLEDIIKVSSTNRDSQYLEILKQLTPERVAWAYSMTITDFGSGGATTYNNVATFNDVLYDKFGRAMEKQLDQARNLFVLGYEGITTNDNLYIHYNEPENPNRLLEVTSWREDWLAGLITLNEYRERRGLPADPKGDIYKGQNTEIKEKIQNNRVNKSFFTKAVLMAAKKSTPAEKALRLKETDVFISKWTNAINNQINDFIEGFKDIKNFDPENFEVKLNKISKFYKKSEIQKDLLFFAGVALDEIKKDKRVKFDANFFDGEYPKEVLEAIKNRTAFIVDGDETYQGMDQATTEILNSYIKDNASEGVLKIATILTELAPELSFERASMIARTEIAEAIEHTREIMYKKNFPDGFKEWQTIVNDVCPKCKGNEDQGQIPINEAFQSGHQRPTAHPRCACTCIYSPDLDA